MPNIKALYVRVIRIDVIPDGVPFIEINIDLHMLDAEFNTVQIVSNYGRIYKRITDLNPIPLGHISDDGAVDNFELMGLVGTAALMWVMQEYGGAINEHGILIIE